MSFILRILIEGPLNLHIESYPRISLESSSLTRSPVPPTKRPCPPHCHPHYPHPNPYRYPNLTNLPLVRSGAPLWTSYRSPELHQCAFDLQLVFIISLLTRIPVSAEQICALLYRQAYVNIGTDLST